MVGYFTEADAGQPLKTDEKEIETVDWSKRGSMPPRASNISISSDMIDAFENQTF